MIKKKRSSSDDRHNADYWLEYGIDIEKRRIDIADNIDSCETSWAIRAVREMEDRSDKPIDVYISSYGGEVYAGLGLYDILMKSKCRIRTHAVGKIMSMAFLIYLSGGERYSTEFSTFMNHSISSMAWGKLYELKAEVKE
jgi:ATP-dependent Clp protease protease subunit